MTIQLGSIAPDFEQDSTQGKIKFHEWAGKSWVVLFSHPKDFTPVCTTELGTVAKLKPEFDKRNVKPIALSVDDVASHVKWTADIEETQHTKLNYPILGDPDRKVADLYGMIHPQASDTATVRSVFVIDPNKKVRLTLTYPASTGPQLRRASSRDRLAPAHRLALRCDARKLEGRRGRHHRSVAPRSGATEGKVPEGLQRREAVSPHHAATQQVSLTAFARSVLREGMSARSACAVTSARSSIAVGVSGNAPCAVRGSTHAGV